MAGRGWGRVAGTAPGARRGLREGDDGDILVEVLFKLRREVAHFLLEACDVMALLLLRGTVTGHW
jgi:hypothetical protein